jgi:hypothetical protein
MVDKKNLLPIGLIGLAWPLFGLGYQAIVINYLPTGLMLLVEIVGMFLAGAISGTILLAALGSMSASTGRILVMLGYLMFAPIGMMAGLITPAPFEPIGGGSWLTFILLVPILMSLVGTLIAGLGMGFTGGLAIAASRLKLKS